MTIISLFNFVVDLVFTLLYFRRHDNSKRRLAYSICSYICLFLTVFLYTSETFPFLSGTVQRFLIRIVLIFLFVYLALPIRLSTALYVVVYWCTLQTLVQSLFFAPFSFPVFKGEAVFTGNAVADLVLSMLITLAVKCLCFIPFLIFTPLVGMSPIYPIDIVPEILLAAVDIYIREITVPLTRSGENIHTELSNYYLILQIVLIIMLGFMEYTRKVRTQRIQDRIKNLETNALLQNIRSNQENAHAISALRHDLKNHLISLKLLNEEGRTEEVSGYIDSLIEQGNAPRKLFRSGNDLADGLLSMKLDKEELKDIDVQVSLDLSGGDFLSNEDLCVLLGNVLDNAVEACREVPEGEEKKILISGGTKANVLLLRFENSCRSMPTLVSGLPMTGKKDASMHGYGLKNVSKVLEKYDGSMSISQGTKGHFVLTMMIPVPAVNQAAMHSKQA